MYIAPSKKTLLVAFYAFLINISTQMLYSHLALFLKFNLDMGESCIGFIDGLAEFISRLVRTFSGVIADYIGDRRILLVIGCSLSCFAKLVFAFVGSAGGILLAEMLERLGAGIQASPRDALVADVGLRNRLGESFGLVKSIKTLGTIFGAATALLLLHFFDGNHRIVFFCAAIPAAAALIFLIKLPLSRGTKTGTNRPDAESAAAPRNKFSHPFSREYLKSLDAHLFFLIVLAFFCEFMHFGESLIILRGGGIVSPTWAGLTTVVMGIGQAILAYPLGLLADKCGKILILALGLFLGGLSCGLLGLVHTFLPFFALVALLYGLQAAVQSILLSLIAENVNRRLYGTAIGIFYCATGGAYLLAAKISGMICERAGYEVAFFCSAAFCLPGLIMLLIYRRIFALSSD
ncbi:MAG: MFS transporter [Holosporaceae bacterium]|jgi:MFS family permease|nr:MFS transporter [Holosporaceae bacterium]